MPLLLAHLLTSSVGHLEVSASRICLRDADAFSPRLDIHVYLYRCLYLLPLLASTSPPRICLPVRACSSPPVWRHSCLDLMLNPTETPSPSPSPALFLPCCLLRLHPPTLPTRAQARAQCRRSRQLTASQHQPLARALPPMGRARPLSEAVLPLLPPVILPARFLQRQCLRTRWLATDILVSAIANTPTSPKSARTIRPFP